MRIHPAYRLLNYNVLLLSIADPDTSYVIPFCIDHDIQGLLRVTTRRKNGEPRPEQIKFSLTCDQDAEWDDSEPPVSLDPETMTIIGRGLDAEQLSDQDIADFFTTRMLGKLRDIDREEWADNFQPFLHEDEQVDAVVTAIINDKSSERVWTRVLTT